MARIKLSGLNNKHFLVLVNNGFVSAFGLATTFVLFHSLSIEGAGLYFFIQSFVALCEAARNGFLQTGTVKFYAGADPARAKTVLGSAWLLAIMLTVVVLLVNAGF